MTTQVQTAYQETAGHAIGPAGEALPTMYDLPSEHPEDGVPDQFHPLQAHLLTETFFPPEHDRERMMTGTELYVYYDVRNTGHYKIPDWFAVLNVPRRYKDGEFRRSYVVWQETEIPFVVVELLSPGTEKEDLGETRRKPGRPPTKWEVYEQILGIPHYAVFDHYTGRFRAFRLGGRKYREIALPDDRLWMPEIKLGMGLWRGRYSGEEHQWLRWYDADGNWIPTSEERAVKEKRRAEDEKARAVKEKRRAEDEKARADWEKRQKEELLAKQEKLIAQLRALGIEPDA